MDKALLFESAFENFETPLIIGDLDYIILYMNDAADDYYCKFGGKKLIGSSIHAHITEEWLSQLNMCIEWFKESENNNKVFSSHKKEENHDVYVVALRDHDKKLIGFCIRHICRTPESGKPYDID